MSLLKLVVLLCLFANCLTIRKYFKYDANIFNRNNWASHTMNQNNCKLWFAEEDNDAPIKLQVLNVLELVFPLHGAVTLQIGSGIVFKKGEMCGVHLKPIQYHSWDNYHNWATDSSNAAVPHLQRLPCQFDDVILPRYTDTRITTRQPSLTLRSFRFSDGTTNFPLVTAEEISGPQSRLFVPGPREPCLGCKCHPHPAAIFCPLEDERFDIKTLPCLTPVQPHDFCHPICGAVVSFKALDALKLQKIEQELAKYASDTHLSAVSDDYGKQMQVVFAENEFEGGSLEDAQNFAELLRKNAEFGVVGVKLRQSGGYHDRNGGSSAVPLVLGTFVAVAMFFGGVFYTRDVNWAKFNVSVPRIYGAGGGFRDGFFARFDTNEENLIIEEQSRAGSVVELDKSFDNPMYGQGAAQRGSEHENPLYNVTLNEE